MDYSGRRSSETFERHAVAIMRHNDLYALTNLISERQRVTPKQVADEYISKSCDQAGFLLDDVSTYIGMFRA